jgi:hypothetical protein
VDFIAVAPAALKQLASFGRGPASRPVEGSAPTPDTKNQPVELRFHGLFFRTKKTLKKRKIMLDKCGSRCYYIKALAKRAPKTPKRARLYLEN